MPRCEPPKNRKVVILSRGPKRFIAGTNHEGAFGRRHPSHYFLFFYYWSHLGVFPLMCGEAENERMQVLSLYSLVCM